MANKMFKYQGNNKELFMKQCMDNGYDTNAVIIVPDTHNALIVKDGRMDSVLESGSHQIFETKKSLFGLVTVKDKSVHTVDVIYMSKTYKLKVLWGTTTKFDLRDPITDVPVKIGACGEFTVQICDPKKAYLELIGSESNYTEEKLKNYLAAELLNEVEPAIARVMRQKNLSYTDFSEYKKEIGGAVFEALAPWFEQSYGLKLFNFIISSVMFSEEDKKRIESVINSRKAETKAKENYQFIKKEYSEIASEKERLNDKAFDKYVHLKEIDGQKYDKYLDTAKEVAKNAPQETKLGRFCSKCGHSYESDAMFCSGCGARVGETILQCPSCGKEYKPQTAYCSGCGHKLS